MLLLRAIRNRSLAYPASPPAESTSMNDATSVVDRVTRVRGLMATRAAQFPTDLDSLQSIFLIGSCSENIPEEWYQDYDVHFLFDGIALKPATLEWLHDLLHECETMSDSSCRIETFLR